METPRLAGGRCVTSLSPIQMLPEVTSSSPAISRRMVDLPQPDGPTKTRNSPSAMSSSTFRMTSVLSNRLVTSFSRPPAIALSLYRAGRETGHQPPLEDQDEGDERHRHDDRGCHDVPPRQLVLAPPRYERD